MSGDHHNRDIAYFSDLLHHLVFGYNRDRRLSLSMKYTVVLSDVLKIGALHDFNCKLVNALCQIIEIRNCYVHRGILAWFLRGMERMLTGT